MGRSLSCASVPHPTNCSSAKLHQMLPSPPPPHLHRPQPPSHPSPLVAAPLRSATQRRNCALQGIQYLLWWQLAAELHVPRGGLLFFENGSHLLGREDLLPLKVSVQSCTQCKGIQQWGSCTAVHPATASRRLTLNELAMSSKALTRSRPLASLSRRRRAAAASAPKSPARPDACAGAGSGESCGMRAAATSLQNQHCSIANAGALPHMSVLLGCTARHNQHASSSLGLPSWK